MSRAAPLAPVDPLAAPSAEPVSTDDAWLAEIQRRRAQLDAGEAPLTPWSEVRAALLDRAG